MTKKTRSKIMTKKTVSQSIKTHNLPEYWNGISATFFTLAKLLFTPTRKDN